jgi:serine/threonine protein kinase
MTAIAEIGMVHRDLAIRNVLLLSYDPTNVGVTCVKVCDFGLSVSTYGKSHRTVVGDTLPVLYMPPESLKKRRYSEKSDVWAFGVTAWELLSDGDIPYVDQLGANPEVGILAYIVGGGRLSQPDGCSDSLWAVVQSCWAKNPMDRPTFTELGVELGRL